VAEAEAGGLASARALESGAWWPGQIPGCGGGWGIAVGAKAGGGGRAEAGAQRAGGARGKRPGRRSLGATGGWLASGGGSMGREQWQWVHGNWRHGSESSERQRSRGARRFFG
jgi:hypothetical protein